MARPSRDTVTLGERDAAVFARSRAAIRASSFLICASPESDDTAGAPPACAESGRLRAPACARAGTGRARARTPSVMTILVGAETTMVRHEGGPTTMVAQ